VRASARRIVALLDAERARGVAPDRIVLAGFSQGGAMALHTGLRHPERLAGIMALSCFLPLADALAAEASPANRDVPVFMAHGQRDELIPLSRAQRGRDVLLGLGYRVEWREYPMPHAVCGEEVGDIAAWLRGILDRKGGSR
jgi:phospholipase/carboxylesterase